MNICVIGTGYVGLVVGTCLSEMGNSVICVDKDKEKLAKLKQGIIPIYEPRLEELILNNVSENRLFFTDDLDDAVKKSDICYIAVGTPQGEDGSANLEYVYDVASSIGRALNGYKIIVDKSTVPVGTGDKVKQLIKEQTNEEFDVVSNPEFLKQGAAVDDFMRPDRVVIGSDSQRAVEIMQELYAPFLRTGNPIIVTDIKSAEMIKYAANSFLATKISFINEIAGLCEKVGADIELVRKGMCSDKRIGPQFLFPGLGYGGSCFPKDVKALIKTANENNYDCSLLKSVDNRNFSQKYLFLEKIFNRFGRDLAGKKFAIWGLAFKPETNDMREAPSITIIKELLKYGAEISACDPKAIETAKIVLKEEKIEYTKSSYDTLKNADALLLLTEWNEFRRPDFDKIMELLKTPIIFDGRNQYNKDLLVKKGFEYYCIGRS